MLCIYRSSDVTIVIIPKPFLSSELHVDVLGNIHKLNRNNPTLLGLVTKAVSSLWGRESKNVKSVYD